MKKMFLVVAVLATITLGSTGTAAAATCSPFKIGPAHFSGIRVTGVSCDRAQQLMDKTTLSSVRWNRVEWRFSEWDWIFAARGETSAVVWGVGGPARIRFVFAVV